MALAFFSTGCIKETYDMKKLSRDEHLSPTMALPAIYGNVGFKDMKIDVTFRFNNLQIIDTVDNFLKMEGSGNNNPLRPENFEMLYLDVAVKNGFPFRVSMQMSLYNSINHILSSTVDATGILEAAKVDINGRVTVETDSKIEIKFTKEFLSSIPVSDKIIFLFTFNTTNNGMNYVAIYPYYRIYFKASMILKPDLSLK